MSLVQQPAKIKASFSGGSSNNEGGNNNNNNNNKPDDDDVFRDEGGDDDNDKEQPSLSKKPALSAAASASTTYRFRQDGEEVIIAVMYKIFALSEVSNTDQTFSCHLGEEMAVFISEEEYHRFLDDPKEFEPDYIPETFPYNGTEWEWEDYLKTSQGHPYYMRQLSAAQNHKEPDFENRCFVWRQRMGKITFNEPFELENFPFDVQTLTMIFQFHTYKDDPSVKFKIHPLYGGAAYSFGFVEPQGEYRVLRKYTKFEVRGTPWMGDSQARCTFVLRRNWTFYFWKVAFVLSVISLTAIVALLVFDSFLDQVGHLSTILLTDVAYLYIVSTYMPTLRYLTYMDWFVMFQIMFVFGIFCEIAIIELMGGPDEANRRINSDDPDSISVGDLMLLVSSAAWVIVNVAFIGLAFRSFHVESRKIQETFGRKYEED
mmetsp:Transcript_25972/g.71532  ORF Transcript_25972/g.71532 Transcript_25972/m.71532 type:complete len:430 (-) Transcript_25972:152-1441(-)